MKGAGERNGKASKQIAIKSNRAEQSFIAGDGNEQLLASQGGDDGKLQTPNSRLQRSFKFQASNNRSNRAVKRLPSELRRGKRGNLSLIDNEDAEIVEDLLG